jgi:hypothetical protein
MYVTYLHDSEIWAVDSLLPKQLKTATDYAEWGYQLMNEDMPNISATDSAKHKANCKTAFSYFSKAIALDSKLALGYEGRGMSLICQNSSRS